MDENIKNENLNEEDKFFVVVDGVEKEATLITILEIASREFAIYSIETSNDSVDILYSEIVKDENGLDTLIDVDDNQIKEQITNAINSMFS